MFNYVLGVSSISISRLKRYVAKDFGSKLIVALDMQGQGLAGIDGFRHELSLTMSQCRQNSGFSKRPCIEFSCRRVVAIVASLYNVVGLAPADSTV